MPGLVKNQTFAFVCEKPNNLQYGLSFLVNQLVKLSHEFSYICLLSSLILFVFPFHCKFLRRMNLYTNAGLGKLWQLYNLWNSTPRIPEPALPHEKHIAPFTYK